MKLLLGMIWPVPSMKLVLSIFTVNFYELSNDNERLHETLMDTCSSLWWRSRCLFPQAHLKRVLTSILATLKAEMRASLDLESSLPAWAAWQTLSQKRKTQLWIKFSTAESRKFLSFWVPNINASSHDAITSRVVGIRSDKPKALGWQFFAIHALSLPSWNRSQNIKCYVV